MILRLSSPARLALIFCLISFVVFSSASAYKKRLRPGLGLGRGLIRASLGTPRRETRIEPRQGGAGLVASAIAYGLASLPFVIFPLMALAPLTYAKVSPLLQNVNEALDGIKEPTSNVPQNPITEILNAAGISNRTQETVTKFAEALGINAQSLDAETSAPMSSPTAQIANALSEAIFSPGHFQSSNPAQNYIPKGKYKPYIFSKDGPLPVTANPLLDGKIEKLHRPSNAVTPASSTGSSSYNPFDDLRLKMRSSRSKGKNSPSTTENLSLVAKDVFKTVAEGFKKYEMEKSDCRERLVCEISQKYAGASFKSWATALMDALELDSKIEAKVAKKNFLVKNIYRGARSSLSDKTCADLFPNCPA